MNMFAESTQGMDGFFYVFIGLLDAGDFISQFRMAARKHGQRPRDGGIQDGKRVRQIMNVFSVFIVVHLENSTKP